VNRKRPKGRDFYDITYLSSRTKPDLGFLNKELGVNTVEGFRSEAGLNLAGPRHFGFDIDYIPIEDQMKDGGVD
jgi:hypothetical protein